MILQKQTFGSGVRCKVDTEYMISKYECSLLNGHPLSGLLKIQEDKGNVLNYLGETKVNLTQKLVRGVNHELLLQYVRQLLRLVGDVQKLGLNGGRLILHTDWIFLNKEETELNFMYCPLNGLALQYNVKLFLQDIVFMASLTREERTLWNKWLDGNKEMTVSSLSMIKKPTRKVAVEDEKTVVDDKSFDTEDDDGEALTDYDEDEYADEQYTFGNHNAFDENGEALTDYDDEDGATTQDESDYHFGMDKEDGTFVESYSQKGNSPDANYPVLRRVSTGEEILITKSEFKIGRSEQRTDFTIKDNVGVSNVHAIIIKQGKSYYIKDKNSTNGTFVNGNVVAVTAPVRLENNSEIELYNEKLIFRV